jgi:hypothetical protein
MRLNTEDAIRDNAAWSYETERFFVGFYAEDEDIDPEDSFEFPEDIEFARSGNDGAWFCARVSVWLKSDSPYDWQEMGADYLGGCSYHSVKEFYTAWRTDPDDSRNTLAMKDKGITICHYFPDMVRTAIAEARTALARMADIAATMRAGA